MRDEYHDVTVYTKEGCQPSKATKIFLMKHGVSYTEINISKNELMRDRLIELGYTAVPVVEWRVNGQQGSWSAFQPDEIELLAKRFRAVTAPTDGCK
ncbi:glutaredoxin domain-containing protein [Nocardia sp. NPDC004151]|uniref:glutaredoxin domain-containing protein n=1 Tax=Nocardia sp. NPDC004151 TaxID=3364304 RepID=UPI0036CFD1EF